MKTGLLAKAAASFAAPGVHADPALRLLIILAITLGLASTSRAEGSYDSGLNQPLFQYTTTSFSTNSGIAPNIPRPLYVDILNSGEVLNIHACGADNDDDIDIEIWSGDGTTQVGSTYQIQETTDAGHVDCSDTFTGNLTNPLQISGLSVGTYQIRFTTLTTDTSSEGFFLNRYNIAVNNGSTTIDPQAAEGRVWSYRIAFFTGDYTQATSTDANYIVVVDSGFSGTYYLWQLDLDDFAGYRYELMANNLGVDSPNDDGNNVAGVSVCMDGQTPSAGSACASIGSTADVKNHVSPMYKMYLNQPEKNYPAPEQNPEITNFYFIDSDNEDNTISPSTSSGVQDSGTFNFTTNLETNGTYELIIDTDGSGTFGSGDVYLRGIANPGDNTIIWDGHDNQGTALGVGNYPATISIRTGEYHFAAIDAETSGGSSGNGLTIHAVDNTTGTTSDTNVYWDDVTSRNLNETDSFNLVGSYGGYHNWGSFSSGGDGNLAIIDTFVYGGSSTPPADSIVVIADNDDTLNMVLTKTSVPENTPLQAGDTIDYSIVIENNETMTLNNIVVTDVPPIGTTLNGVCYVSGFTYSSGSATTGTDDFSSGGLTGGSGWTGNWTASGGVAVQVSGGELQIAGDNDNSREDGSVVRQIDFTGFSTATFSFDYRGDSMEDTDTLWVEVSDDGGSSWAIVLQQAGDQLPATLTTVSQSVSVGSDTRIRFRTNTNRNNDTAYFDNVSITASTQTKIAKNMSCNAFDEIVSASDGFILEAGDDMNISFQVTVDPLDGSLASIDNTVTAASDEIGYREDNTSDPVVPTVSIDDVTVNEGNDLVFTVALSHATTTNVTVDISQTAGTADTSDYTVTTTTVTILAGDLNSTVSVPSIIDTIDEDDEQFTLNGSVTSGNTANTDPSGTGTILDDDTATVLSVTSDTVEEGNDLVHTVTMSGAADSAKIYTFTIVDNTTASGDYTFPPTFSDGVTYSSGEITVPAYVTSFTVTTPTNTDANNEDSEFYDLTVGGQTATGTILDTNEMDFADLPTSYEITLSDDGARHNILGSGNPYLGSTPPDADSDGQESTDADGDELDGGDADEEDGVHFIDPMVAGSDADLNVTASTECNSVICYFSAWMDFNQDGDLDDAGEQIFADQQVTAGKTTLTYSVPSGTNTGQPIYMMSRLTTDAGIGNRGYASDGEVETYLISDPSTLPITLAYVYPQRYGNLLKVAFSTASETSNVGFNIYAVSTYGSTRLNKAPIVGAIDSFEPHDYMTVVEVPDRIATDSIMIAGIDYQGREELHGPFSIGEIYGSLAPTDTIDWETIKTQVAKSSATKATLAAVNGSLIDEFAASVIDDYAAAEAGTESLITLQVSQSGIQHVTHAALMAAGIDLRGTKYSDVTLSFRGQTVSRNIGSNNKAHTFNPWKSVSKWDDNSWIEFSADAPAGDDALYLDHYNYALAVRSGAAVTSSARLPIMEKSAHFEINNLYSNSLPNGDPFYEAFFFALGEDQPGNFVKTFELPALAQDGTSTLTVGMMGFTETLHPLNVYLNGTFLAHEEAFGWTNWPLSYEISNALLLEGANELTLELEGRGSTLDMVVYDHVTLTYDDGTAQPTRTCGVETTALMDASAILPPEGTDYLIITHPIFLTEALSRYVTERQQEGWKIHVADVEEIYAAFDQGMPTPVAIQAYLEKASDAGVTHVQLIGAATYDPHDYLGTGAVNLIPSIYVPTFDIVSQTPCDSCYALDKNSTPTLAIGRWPVRTAEELDTVITKTLAWKNSGQDGVRTALFIADKDDEGIEFDQQMEQTYDLFTTMGWNDVTRVYLQNLMEQSPDTAVVDAREAIFEAFRENVGIVSYSGHSAVSRWSFDDLVRQNDIGSFENDFKPAIVMPLACFTTFADSPYTNTMAHQWLAAGTNGAVAVFGASALSNYDDNGVVITHVINAFLNGKTLGMAIRDTKIDLGSGWSATIYNSNLLGDVTLQLR